MKKVIYVIICLTGIITMQRSSAQVCLDKQNPKVIEPSQARQMCTSDFNNDGKKDLAVSNIDGTISVLLGNGSGGFSSVWIDSADNYTQSICTADFNMDGKADLAVYNSGFGQITILLGNGSGQFAPTGSFFTGYYNANNTLCAADINSDGKMDIAFSTSFNVLAMLYGFGNGAFGQVLTVSTNFPVYGLIQSTDFNNDSKADVLCKNGLLVGDGSGGFVSSAPFASADNPTSATYADFTGDDTLDVMVANYKGGSNSNLALYVGNGFGGFAAPVYFSLGDSTGIPSNGLNFICSDDFNNDATPDVAVGTYDFSSAQLGSRVALLINNGSGILGLPVHFLVDDFVKALVPADLNGDGKMDLSVLTRNTTDSSRVTVMLNCFQPNGLIETQQHNIRIYPNPAHGELTIAGLISSNDIDVLDGLGKRCFQIKSTSSEVILNLPHKGIYFVRIRTQDGTLLNTTVINEE